MVQWLVLSAHSKKVPGLNPPFCADFAYCQETAESAGVS